MMFRTLARSVTWLGAAALVGALALGCDKGPTENKAMAEVGAASGTAKVVTGTRYAFSESGSKLGFVGAKVTGSHDGSFGKFSGTITIPDGAIDKGTVSVEIDMASVTTDSDMLTGHLKKPDFFDVEKFPKASFAATGVKSGGDKGASHTVTGNLTLHGVTKSISFPATIKVEGDAVTVDAEFGINRKDFGIEYAGKKDDLIKDEVLLKLKLKATKA